VVLPTLALGAFTFNPQTLPAGGNAALSVPVLSNGRAYTPPLQVSFTSPCIRAGKAVLGSPVTTQNGVATASYTDQGCGVSDLVTATVTLGDSTATQSGSINVQPASAGSLGFVSSDTTNIALLGTGGVGRQEFATLRFKVYDTTGNALSGANVSFDLADQNGGQITASDGLTLNPPSATTSADGTATTLVYGGTRSRSLRVKASVDVAGRQLSTLSNVLVVSTGMPVQERFSLSTSTGNCEGWSLDQDECSLVTVRMADHFGNPVPDGTAVNFTVEGGNVEASCITGQLLASTTPMGQSTNSKQGPGSGACSVKLRSSNPRPAEPLVPYDPDHPALSRRGRITLLAYALGEEDFTDLNGNQRCDNCDTPSSAATSEFTPAQDLPRDVYRDDDENGAYTGGEACAGPDTSIASASGPCTTAADGRYNGVLRYPPAPGTASSTLISAQLVQTFSGSDAFFEFVGPAMSCSTGTGSVIAQFHVRDLNGNPMPAGTTIKVSALFGSSSATVIPAQHVVNNYVLAVGELTPQPLYQSVVGCPVNGPGTLIVEVETPVKKVKTTTTQPIN
jgi:hypothetical protein